MIQPHQRISGRQCAVCMHVRRIEIELDLAKDVAQKKVAQAYGLSQHVVHRHWRRHVDAERLDRLRMGPVQRAALTSRLDEQDVSTIDDALVVRSALYERLDAAVKVGDDRAVDRITGRMHENIRLRADITGQIRPMVSNTLNLYTSPDWARAEAFMLEALEDEPRARVKLLQAFRRAEMSDEPQVPQALPAIEHEGSHAVSAAESGT